MRRLLQTTPQLASRWSHPAAVVVMLFASVIAIGTLLLMTPWAHADGSGTGLITAVFTATSAVCVTGLVVVDTATHWSPFGLLTILVLIQLGGFGMMASASLMALLIGRRMGLQSRLALQVETRSLALADVKSLVVLILAVTVVVEGLTALWLASRFEFAYGMGWPRALWTGLFHAVSAFNNAGFSTFSDNVMGFAGDGWVLSALMVSIVVGGLGFPVLHELIVRGGADRRRPRRSMHTVMTLWGSAALILGGAVVMLLAESSNPLTLAPLSAGNRVLAALFASVSARTAGFNSIDIGALTTESLALLYALMFIGGGSAGTAGGVKVTTFFVLLLVGWNEIRGHRDVEFNGRRIDSSVQRQALTILMLSAGVVVIAVLALQPMTALPFEKVLFEVISAFATVGLSTGITAELPPQGQLILVALMFLGRVGVVTLAAALALNHGRRGYRYPEEKPIVG